MKHSLLKLSFPILILLSAFCSKKREIEFCFTSIINGSVAVGTVVIGEMQIPCGYLSAGGGPWSNQEYDFAALQDPCGKSASGYHMVSPDSAYLGWTVEYEGQAARPDLWERYEKKIALPPFPRIDPAYKYQVSFVIGYQDCVYCRIDPIPR